VRSTRDLASGTANDHRTMEIHALTRMVTRRERRRGRRPRRRYVQASPSPAAQQAVWKPNRACPHRTASYDEYDLVTARKRPLGMEIDFCAFLGDPTYATRRLAPTAREASAQGSARPRWRARPRAPDLIPSRRYRAGHRVRALVPEARPSSATALDRRRRPGVVCAAVGDNRGRDHRLPPVNAVLQSAAQLPLIGIDCPVTVIVSSGPGTRHVPDTPGPQPLCQPSCRCRSKPTGRGDRVSRHPAVPALRRTARGHGEAVGIYAARQLGLVLPALAVDATRQLPPETLSLPIAGHANGRRGALKH
jgi:hypothetical protein